MGLFGSRVIKRIKRHFQEPLGSEIIRDLVREAKLKTPTVKTFFVDGVEYIRLSDLILESDKHAKEENS